MVLYGAENQLGILSADVTATARHSVGVALAVSIFNTTAVKLDVKTGSTNVPAAASSAVVPCWHGNGFKCIGALTEINT